MLGENLLLFPKRIVLTEAGHLRCNDLKFTDPRWHDVQYLYVVL